MLAEQPLCAGYPPGTTCTTLATEDDHIVPWFERHQHGLNDQDWDHPANHQGLCTTHHRKKTDDESQRAHKG